MKEETLMKFFTGSISIEKLCADSKSIVTQTSPDVFEHQAEPMKKSFTVTRPHMVKLCKVTIDGSLEVENLSAICLVMELSENFIWCADGCNSEILSDVANFCASPEINYPLARENLKLFQEYLESGNNPLS